ncbi:uncharacterized protein LOC123309093 [Coccinella septempunctata]|uniref:uncharacterized protein LOC123309093 n=1 Tax=Coccinella septempunctata TaxID=41139 RepID=UPI001D07405F|nr:uncharacterized protein LOC123309093 [Coccinella septempunctata]
MHEIKTVKMKNVEIKASIENRDELESIINEMNLGSAEVIIQHDIFFKTPKGRLKMRKFKDNGGELIFYERDDTEGPKLSTYNKMNLSREDVANLSTILSQSLGVHGEVKKTRYLYLFEQTRIHIDYVEELGNFLELEVVLTPNQSPEEGQMIAESIMKKLKVDSKNLISCSYMDLIKNK